jgi:hypothetical protein
MLLGLILTTVTTGQSGYVQIFLFFLVFAEPWRGFARVWMLLSAYLLCIPADLVLIPVIHQRAWSYLAGHEVTADFGISLGQVVRPAILMIVQFCLISLNVGDLARDWNARRRSARSVAPATLASVEPVTSSMTTPASPAQGSATVGQGFGAF